MNRHRIVTAAGVAGLLLLAGWAHPVAQIRPAGLAAPSAPTEVTAHEWGTFTSVADEQGAPSQWLPLAGPGDLPCFVDYYQNRLFKALGPDTGASLDYHQARTKIRGTVRMETPVIYFYANKDTSLDVSVKFPDGLFTEWYPRAEV